MKGIINNVRAILLPALMVVGTEAWAAEAAAPSPTGGLFRMLLGLIAVLAVMALIVWAMKRFTPGSLGQASVVSIVGGVSVGTRERVVVVEVADRWLVVGVAPGQISSLANLDAGTASAEVAAGIASEQPGLPLHPFAKWLKQAHGKRHAE